MKHTLIICFLFLCFFSTFELFSQEKQRVAVLPFEAIGTSEVEAQVLTKLFESALVKTEFYTIIEQAQLEMILKAQAFSLSGCTDESCAIEVGQLLSAEYVVSGSLSRLGDKYVISAKLIDIELGKSVYSDFLKIDKIEEMTDGAVTNLVKVIIGEEFEDDKQKRSFKFNRDNRNVYWQNQIGGGGIFSTGLSWFFLSRLSLDILGGLSYYSYDHSANEYNGALIISSAQLSLFWFNYFLTPYIGAGIAFTSDTNRIDLLMKGTLGLQLNKIYLDLSLFYPMTDMKYSYSSDPFKISLGIKI